MGNIFRSKPSAMCFRKDNNCQILAGKNGYGFCEGGLGYRFPHDSIVFLGNSLLLRPQKYLKMKFPMKYVKNAHRTILPRGSLSHIGSSRGLHRSIILWTPFEWLKLKHCYTKKNKWCKKRVYPSTMTLGYAPRFWSLLIIINHSRIRLLMPESQVTLVFLAKRFPSFRRWV